MPDCARGLHGVVWSLGGEGSLRLFGRTFVEPNAVKFTCTNNVWGLSVWGSMLLHVIGFWKFAVAEVFWTIGVILMYVVMWMEYDDKI